MTLQAVDYDTGDNARLEFEAVEMPKDNQDRELFTLLPSGELQTTITISLDREETDYYTAVVRVHDFGSPQMTSGRHYPCHVRWNTFERGLYQYYDPMGQSNRWLLGQAMLY